MRNGTVVALTAALTAAVAAPAVVYTHGAFGTTVAAAASSASSAAPGSTASGSAAPGTSAQPGSGAAGASTVSGTSGRATDQQSRGVVMIDTVLTNGEAAGTGMVLTSDGTVLTNYHVVEDSTLIRVTVPGGNTYSATVVGHDKTHDVAVLRLKNASGLTTVKLDTDGVKTSERVLAVGQGDGEGVLYAATGQVTALGRSITANDTSSLSGGESLTGLIQTNAPIVGGYSGGPLFDADGEVIGIDTAAAASNSLTGYTPGQSAQQAEGYAIPITEAKSIADTILKGTKTATNHIGTRSALGIGVVPSSSQQRGGADAQSSGVTVQGLTEGSAVASTGIEAGDTITAIGGRRISDSSDLAATMDRTYPGQKTTVTWVDTTGTSHTATVTLGVSSTN